MALGVVMVATLVGLLVSDGEAGSSAWQFGMLLAAAAIAALVHGRVSESIPLRTHFRWCIAAIPAAAVTFAIAIGYVALLPSLPGPDDTAPAATPLLALVVFAPIGEELLCRGVAYRAGLSLASPRAAILLAAIVFAFLHGLGGGWVLELPHRFAAGVVFGWLRWRSGSLLPAMLAHALHNGVAWWWDGAGGS